MPHGRATPPHEETKRRRACTLCTKERRELYMEKRTTDKDEERVAHCITNVRTVRDGGGDQKMAATMQTNEQVRPFPWQQSQSDRS